MKMEGMDDLMRALEDLRIKAMKLGGEHRVGVHDLLTPEFMSLHTRFPSFDAMLDSSTWDIASQEDFDAIPDEPWDEYVRETTDFHTWQEMLSAAGEEWIASQLDF